MATKPSSMEQPTRAGAGRAGRAGAGVYPEAAGAVEERRYDVPEDERVAREDPTTPATRSVSEDGATIVSDPPERAMRGQRLRTTMELIRSNPTGRIALKVFVGIGGLIVVTLGLALIPLPGPGWLIVIGGLGIWAVEFHWAKRLLNFTRRNVYGWARWARRQSLPVRIALGSVGLVFLAVIVWLSLKYSLGIDLVARAMHHIATH